MAPLSTADLTANSDTAMSSDSSTSTKNSGSSSDNSSNNSYDNSSSINSGSSSNYINSRNNSSSATSNSSSINSGSDMASLSSSSQQDHSISRLRSDASFHSLENLDCDQEATPLTANVNYIIEDKSNNTINANSSTDPCTANITNKQKTSFICPKCIALSSTTLSASILPPHPVCACYLPREVLEFIAPPSTVMQTAEPYLRMIFGNQKLKDYEVEREKDFYDYIIQEGVDINSNIFNDKLTRLRFLQGNEWDKVRCLEDMKRHVEWRNATLPIPRDHIIPLLNAGYCYVHGRDRFMRPILIIRCKGLLNAQHEDVMKVIVYWLEYLIDNLLVFGRVEQWMVILDLNNCSMYNIPARILKDVSTTLARNYRGRLHRMCIIYSPYIFWGIWQVVSIVLPETTKRKISIYSTGYEKDLIDGIHQKQLEERYGGELKNCEIFEHPCMPPAPFQ